MADRGMRAVQALKAGAAAAGAKATSTSSSSAAAASKPGASKPAATATTPKQCAASATKAGVGTTRAATTSTSSSAAAAKPSPTKSAALKPVVSASAPASKLTGTKTATASAASPAKSAAGAKPAAAAGAGAAVCACGALMKDIESGQLQAVQDRLSKGVSPNQTFADPKDSSARYTPLHAAVRGGSLAIVQALLGGGADAAATDSAGDTALHWLAASGGGAQGLAIAEALLQAYPAAVATPNAAGLTPLHLAAQGGHAGLLRTLCSAPGADTQASQPGYTPMHAAARAGGAECMAVLAGAGAAGGGLSVVDAEGRTPLLLLLEGGHVAAAVAALGLGGDCGVNVVGRDGRTALMLVVQWAASQPTQATGAAADPLTASGSAGTSLLATGGVGGAGPSSATAGVEGVEGVGSVKAPGLQLVEALLAAGASPDAVEPQSRRSVVMAAIAAKLVPIAKVLIRASTSIGARSPGGESALSLAQSSGEEALVGAVMAALGPDAAPQAEALALLRAALEAGRDESVGDLMGAVKLSALDALGLDARGLLSRGMGAAALALVRRRQPGSGPDCVVDEDNSTLLHWAAGMEVPGAGGAAGAAEGQSESGAYCLVTCLLRLGLSCDAQTKEGLTPLHVAARAGSVGACRALVEAGADPTKRNAKNRTPGNQPKIPDATRDYLTAVEEEYKRRKEERKADMFGSKIQATQTESAFGVRVM